jgi:hypothetical protein
LKRTRSQPTNISTLIFWVNGIVFHKGRDNSLLNCWPWRASWFYEQQSFVHNVSEVISKCLIWPQKFANATGMQPLKRDL